MPLACSTTCIFLERRLVNLRHAALVDAQHAADFLHRHLVGVVQQHHFLIPLRQRLHGDAQHARSCSRAQMESGCVSGLLGKSGAGRSSLFVGAGGGRDQADVAQVQHHAAPAVDVHAQLLRRLRIRWDCAAARRQFARRGFHLLVAAAHVARGPVELAQAIEDRALDAVLGVARKDDLFFGIVLAGGVEQAEDAGVNQIVQIDVHRQIFVHADGDGLDQRQMLQHHAVAAIRLTACAAARRCAEAGRNAARGVGSAESARRRRAHRFHWHATPLSVDRSASTAREMTAPMEGTAGGAMAAAAAAL